MNNSLDLKIQKELASYCFTSNDRGNGNEIFWDSWSFIFDQPNFSKISTLFFDRFSTILENVDAICGIPQSGMPLATIGSLMSGKPLFGVDFSTEKLKTDHNNQLNKDSRILAIDTAINSGLTIVRTHKILEKYFRPTIKYLVIVDNSEEIGKTTVDNFDIVNNDGEIDSLIKMSELIGIT